MLLYLPYLPQWPICPQSECFPKEDRCTPCQSSNVSSIDARKSLERVAIMQHVIFPPAGLDRPIVGSQADCLDPTSEMLAAYSHKYALTKDPNDRVIANQIFEAILKLEKVTGVPGLVARSFNRTDEPLWHEEVLWQHEWHSSTSMPGYRWLGNLSSDKFTSIFYGVGTFWKICANDEYKQKAADLLDRFMGSIIDNNSKLTDLSHAH